MIISYPGLNFWHKIFLSLSLFYTYTVRQVNFELEFQLSRFPFPILSSFRPSALSRNIWRRNTCPTSRSSVSTASKSPPISTPWTSTSSGSTAKCRLDWLVAVVWLLLGWSLLTLLFRQQRFYQGEYTSHAGRAGAGDVPVRLLLPPDAPLRQPGQAHWGAPHGVGRGALPPLWQDLQQPELAAKSRVAEASADGSRGGNNVWYYLGTKSVGSIFLKIELLSI